ncbi:MAG: hypothetical protein UT55_C0087G0002 [Candidatus Peregrinibacteria bacterium GW2011_GWE2_39_6]|nr:MAG: hypothetical protein UT36_C0001G0050 [Candidatus Peregrinibacteria bacterium GW2011_GWF2_39_17]KKR23605.1 MAG: hypothetical protein UT55_C0087G0002 [Candidatus Peregrinibacteria bacterium GW2011_GWE2_39_6]HCW32392.1 hypothetical protein [Candidatus Peregrinibacteria bacterium]
MSLFILPSAYYLKIGNRVINKITDDYNPPRFWFRLKVCAKGRPHRQVGGQIINLWWGNFRKIKDFDPLNFLWVNEPLQVGDHGESVVRQYFKPDIEAGSYELAGLLRSKLPMRPMDPSIPLPEENIPDEQLPEVELDQSLNEPRHVKKRRAFSYGIYYAQVLVADNDGNKAKKSFKIWAFRDAKKCKMRTTRFYERWLLTLKLLLPAV